MVFRLANWWVIGYQFFFVHWDGFRASNGYMQFVLVINFVFLFLLNHVYFFISGPFLGHYGLASRSRGEGGAHLDVVAGDAVKDTCETGVNE
jgi:hypothetical protein